MAITLDDRKNFYAKLMEKDNLANYRDDLKSSLSFDDSKFNELYSQLGSVGFIKNGIDGTFRKRYQVTAFGEEQMGSFLRVYNL